MNVEVTFTEIVTRTVVLDLDLPDGPPDDESDLHVLIDQQQAWDQVPQSAWLDGDVENRTVDSFAVPAEPLRVEVETPPRASVGAAYDLSPGEPITPAARAAVEKLLDPYHGGPFEGDLFAQLVHTTLHDRGFTDAEERMVASGYDFYSSFGGKVVDEIERALYTDSEIDDVDGEEGS